MQLEEALKLSEKTETNSQIATMLQDGILMIYVKTDRDDDESSGFNRVAGVPLAHLSLVMQLTGRRDLPVLIAEMATLVHEAKQNEAQAMMKWEPSFDALELLGSHYEEMKTRKKNHESRPIPALNAR